MSRSRKKPYYKDKGLVKNDYWKIIRHEWKQKLNENYYKDDFYLRSPKAIVNDWDYCDYSFYVFVETDSRKITFWSNYRGWTEEDVKKYSRK